MIERYDRIDAHARARRVGIALLTLVAALARPVSADEQLVVVRKSGQATSYSSQLGIGASARAVCSDQSVAFAFVAVSRDGTRVSLQRGVDTTREIVIEVTLTCSSLIGTALVPFDAVGGDAIRGSDYVSTPGVALLRLSLAAGEPGAGAPVAAVVRIDLVDNTEAATATRTFSISRREGSFQGMYPGGTAIVGSIPANDEALVAVSILPPVTIVAAAAQIAGIDPAADQVSAATTAFCRPGGGGAGSIGCLSTQRAARLISDPATPANVRTAAVAVLENNLLAIAPDETTALAFVAPRIASGQLDNLAQRLAALRGGADGSGVSSDGLTLLSNGMPLSLGMLPALLRADGEGLADNEEQRTLLGGTRFGLWINGTLGGGERDRRTANSGFESDTWDLTSGLDYRFNDRLFAGIGLGYSRFTADFDRDQGSLDANARSVHGYAGYALPNGLSFDGSLSVMRSNYSERRVIELYALDVPGTGFDSLGRDIAEGDTTVRQRGGSVGVTYTIMHNAWTIAPQLQVSALRTDYAAFSETGPSPFNLGYRERHGKSRSVSAGAYVDRAYATAIGAFRPYGRAFYYADSGPSKDLLADFVLANDDGTRTALRLSMNEPDRRYATGELGLAFSRPIGTRTVDFNVGYMQMFSFVDWNRWALRFDVRIPL